MTTYVTITIMYCNEALSNPSLVIQKCNQITAKGTEAHHPEDLPCKWEWSIAPCWTQKSVDK